MHKKKLIFITLYFMCHTDVFAQKINNGDSLIFYLNKNDYKQAAIFGERDVDSLRKIRGEKDTLYGAAINNLATVYFSDDNYDAAESLYVRAAEIYKQYYGERNADYLFIIKNLGQLESEKGNFSAAEKYLTYSAKMQKEISGEKSAYYANALSVIGILYRSTGRLQEAATAYKESMNIFEAMHGKEDPDYLRNSGNLIIIYQLQGNYAAAEKMSLELLAVKRKVFGANQLDYAIGLDNLAAIYYSLGNFRRAIKYYDSALVIVRETIGERGLYASIMGNLGTSYLKINDFVNAEIYIKRQVEITKALNNPREYAAAVDNLAEMFVGEGKDSLSEALFKESIELRKLEDRNRDMNYAISMNNLGIYYARQKKFSSADSLYKESADVTAKIFGEESLDVINILNNRCELFQLTGAYKAGDSFLLNILPEETALLEEKQEFLSEPELLAYLQNNEFGYALPYSSLMHFYTPGLAEAAYNAHLLISGIALRNTATLAAEMENARDSETVALWKSYRNNKALLNKLMSQPSDKRPAVTDSVREATNAAEKKLLGISSTYRKAKEQLNIRAADIRGNLKEGEAAIEFIRYKYIEPSLKYKYYYAAMLLRKYDTVPVFVRLFEEGKLETALAKFPYASRPGKPGMQAAGLNSLPGADMYTLLWKPLETYLKNIHTIYYSPDGLLHRLAFSAIPVQKSLLLCDRYRLMQVTSTREIVDEKNKPDSLPGFIALFGGINYNSGRQINADSANHAVYSYAYLQNRGAARDSFPYLPGSLAEVERIRKSFLARQKPVSVYTGVNASEQAFRNLSGNRSPDIIHFATHGFTLTDTARDNPRKNIFTTADNPLLRTGLVMAGGNAGWKGKTGAGEDDGILTGLEIASLPFQHTRLVVLSACETAAGELRGAEGVFGLQRAFKIAGVKYVMASLWQVPDKETGEFMQYFYSSLLSRKDISSAFIIAQKQMRKKYPPYYWAGFTLVK